VRVGDVAVLAGLAKDLSQAHDRHGPRGNDVRQHLPRPDRRQLIDIADQEEGSPVRQGAEQRPHQRHVDHRGLVDDQQIAIERRVPAAPEAASPRVGFKQAMDGLRLKSGAFGEALCGTAGRRTEPDLNGLREKDLEDGVDDRRFSDARPAGHHQHPGGECDADGLLLALGKRQFRPPLYPADLRPPGSEPSRFTPPVTPPA
jgi:hypothetical protein